MGTHNEESRRRSTKCFGCGADNPAGLKLKFKWDGGKAVAEFTPQEAHQGWPGVVHGGLLATMLDEAGGWCSMEKGLDMVTAKMEVLFRNPAEIGVPLIITGAILRENTKRFEAYSCITTRDGTVIAESNSVYIIKQGGPTNGGK
ncbi:MAG: PaaI family thioesterase [Dehalococcoidales bacterium]|nr:PaaI family thioesterase [Dehalococcoidales bacterium]